MNTTPEVQAIRVDACIHIDVYAAPAGVVLNLRNGENGAHGSYATCLHLSPEQAYDLAVALLAASAQAREAQA